MDATVDGDGVAEAGPAAVEVDAGVVEHPAMSASVASHAAAHRLWP